MSKPPHQRPDDAPAWPLGCAVALLAILLSFNLAGILGILFAVGGLPPWVERAAPLLGWLPVPLLMLAGWALGRRRNPYGARVLLWGFAFTLVFLSAMTAFFDFVDRLNGL